jgi:cbb3-type cytochrome oxidase cytochrome c subunit
MDERRKKYWLDENLKAKDKINKSIKNLEFAANDLFGAETTICKLDNAKQTVHEMRALIIYVQSRLAAIQDMDEEEFDKHLADADDEYFSKQLK